MSKYHVLMKYCIITALSAITIPCCSAEVVLPVEDVPQRTEDNLIVAVYNIKFFGREAHDIEKLAEVIQHFDVCGILEVRDEHELPVLVDALEELTGEDWGFTFGVRTHRPGGSYHEAYAAVWRRDRVEIGDGVIGGIWDLEEAYRNDPYLISFRRKGFDFILALIHTRWSDDVEGTRRGEVLMVPEHVHWMRGFIDERDVIIAGDFNYKGSDEPMEMMKEEANLIQLDRDPKSTFKMDGSGFASSYDHMFVVRDRTPEYKEGSCNTLHVSKLVYGSDAPLMMRKARRDLSDHLPIFAEFIVSDEDDDP